MLIIIFACFLAVPMEVLINNVSLFVFDHVPGAYVEILIFTKRPNSYSGILQLSQYLAFAPQLETLEVHVSYCVSYLVFAHLSFLLPLLPNSS
jgi:hypothetical protein